MKVYQSREISFHLDGNKPPEIWMWWGNLKQRVRFQPEYVTVTWRRRDGEAWVLVWVTVSGPRIHRQTNHNIGETFVDCGVEKHPMPDWLAGLVDVSSPVRLAEVTA